MVMNKRGQDLMTIIVPLIVVVVIAVIIIGFNQSSIGKASGLLGANDADVIVAAGGCSVDLAIGPPNLFNKFCYDFKTIEKKSWLGFSTQLVNCNYLNNTIKTTVPDADLYATIICPATVWEEQCQLRLNENSDSSDYSILINGKKCSKKELAEWRTSIQSKVLLAEDRYYKLEGCNLVPKNTYVLKDIMVYSWDATGGKVANKIVPTDDVYFKDKSECDSKAVDYYLTASEVVVPTAP